MVSFPALSITETVERVGAYVGIASFFGIALLAVLYFAQARELKRLRDWAGRAPERAHEHEQRVADTGAASGVVPSSDDAASPASGDRPGAADEAASPTGAVPAEPATEVYDASAAGSETPAPGEAVAAVPASAVAAPRPATAAALRAGRPSTTLPRRPSPPPPAPAPARRQRGGLGSYAIMGVVALLVLAIGAVALSTLGGDDPATAPEQAQVQPTPTATPTTDPAADRAETTVAVLNGTTTTGLAAELVEQLTQAGYQEGPRGNNADQQREASVVLYRDGFDGAARDVSDILDIPEVQPMDEQTAGQPIGDAQVVVIAGQDQAP